MRLAILPTVLLLTATIGTAAAAETDSTSMCMSTCTACIRATPTPASQDTAGAPKPWYIGPKGGDTRKGHTASPGELMAASHGKAPDPVGSSDQAQTKPWYIGPKGGDTRKGHTASRGEAGTVTQINEKPAVYCDRYVAPDRGPKGGLLKRKGQSDSEVQHAADVRCWTLCHN